MEKRGLSGTSLSGDQDMLIYSLPKSQILKPSGPGSADADVDFIESTLT